MTRRPAKGGDGFCHGTFLLGGHTGAISVRRNFGSDGPPAPAESDDDYRVTFFSTSEQAATTPLGIGPGSTYEQCSRPTRRPAGAEPAPARRTAVRESCIETRQPTRSSARVTYNKVDTGRNGVVMFLQSPGGEAAAAVGATTFADSPETGEATVEFEEFVRAGLPGLLRYGHALTGSPHDGADLVQTVLEKVGSRWAKLMRQGIDPQAYVRRSMANAHVSRWRRRRREVLLDEFPDRGVSQPDRLDGEPMWQALAGLPPRQRAVLVLRYYEELSEAEIASVLGISAGTVKSQASKALAKLRASLASVEGNDR